jgi:hypothetical protein
MDNPPKVLVSGDRNWTYGPGNTTLYYRLVSTLDTICVSRGWYYGELDGNWLPHIHIINGKASGVDSMATDYAVVNWCRFTEVPANWSKYGKSAGPRRNYDMLRLSPALVVAFHNDLGTSKGTKHMVKIARKVGIETEVYSEQHRYSEEEIATATS